MLLACVILKHLPLLALVPFVTSTFGPLSIAVDSIDNNLVDKTTRQTHLIVLSNSIMH
jgi:hypothetical protein